MPEDDPDQRIQTGKRGIGCREYTHLRGQCILKITHKIIGFLKK
jgi:hypothetical protein